MYDNNLKKFATNYEFSKNVEEDLELSEQKFRIEFLEIFGANDICDDFINETIRGIYEKIKDIELMKKNLIKLAAKFLSEDLEIGLMVGFCYDYLFLMHPCICDFLEKGEISMENLNALNISLDNV
jgi:hypothetical protein